MRFGAPQFFPLLIIVPLTIFFYLWAFKKKRILIEKYLAPELKPRLITSFSYAKSRLQATLLICCLLFAIGAVVQPKWGFHWEKVNRRGADIIIALDVSKSMLAEDIAPNRITRAKRKIEDLLQTIQGDRVGLIAFAGVAHLQSPLTTDYGAVAIFLDAIDTELIPVQGTAIGETITTAIRAFEASPKNGGRVLILMTDGEDLAGDAMKAAVAAKEAGVQIYTIGIGKAAGAPIPVAGGGFKKDQKGELVLTRLDESMLKEIALTTGGGYVQSIAGNEDLNQIYKTIQTRAGEGTLKTDRKQIFVERYQWPLLVAFFCLVLERLLSNRISIRSAQLILLISMTLLFGEPVWAGSTERGAEAYKKGEYSSALKEFQDAQVDAPQRPDRNYNAANSYYKTKQYDEADRLFSSVSKSDNRALKEKGFYNGGNTAYRQGKLDVAVDAYKKALEIDPKDEDAKYNLNFVQQEIARRLAKKKKSQSSSDGDKKDAKGKQGKGDQEDEKKGKQTASASAGDKKNQGEEKRNKKFDNQDKQMTKEEAKQWLALVKEDRSMSNQKEKEKKERPYPVGKDW